MKGQLTGSPNRVLERAPNDPRKARRRTPGHSTYDTRKEDPRLGPRGLQQKETDFSGTTGWGISGPSASSSSALRAWERDSLGPGTTQCQACAETKIHRQVSRGASQKPPTPCKEIHIDWTDMKGSYEGFQRIMFLTDAASGDGLPVLPQGKGRPRPTARFLTNSTPGQRRTSAEDPYALGQTTSSWPPRPYRAGSSPRESTRSPLHHTPKPRTEGGGPTPHAPRTGNRRGTGRSN